MSLSPGVLGSPRVTHVSVPRIPTGTYPTTYWAGVRTSLAGSPNGQAVSPFTCVSGYVLSQALHLYLLAEAARLCIIDYRGSVLPSYLGWDLNPLETCAAARTNAAILAAPK